MKKQLRINLRDNGYVFVITLFIITDYIVENINGRFWLNDFQVYYEATKAFVNAAPVYGIPFGLSTGFYKYSPSALLLFLPTIFLPVFIARTIHFLLIGLALIITIAQTGKLSQIYFNVRFKSTIYFLVPFIICAVHIVRELHLGNTNVVLLFVIVSAVLNMLYNRLTQAAVLLSIAIIFKPYFILIIIPLIVYKEFKVIKHLVIYLILSAIIVLIVSGVNNSILLYKEWIKAMMDHGNYLASKQTISSIIETFTNYQNHLTAIIIIAAILIIYLVFILMSSQHSKLETSNENINNQKIKLGMDIFLLISILPNILITDTEHFLFSLPIITYITTYLKFHKDPYILILFIIGVALYSLNSTDLLGHHLSDIVENYGLLGIGNLMFIGIFIYLRITEH